MDELLISNNNGIANITLNRPEKRNALNGPLVNALLEAIKKISKDPAIRILIINANGDHFCAGADIAWMKKISEGTQKENEEDAQLLSDLMYQLYLFPKPSIVLAHGATLGGGLGLISICDIAIASSDARFAFSEVKIGVVPSIISPYVLSAIGERAARYYFLTGENFDALDAKRLGLIHHIVEKDQLISKGMQLAQTLLQNGPEALIAAKALIHSVSAEKISKKLSHETAQGLAHLRASKEAREGLKAFLEKRKPNWSEYDIS